MISPTHIHTPSICCLHWNSSDTGCLIKLLKGTVVLALQNRLWLCRPWHRKSWPQYGHGMSCWVPWDWRWWFTRPDLFVAWKVHPGQSQLRAISDWSSLSVCFPFFPSFLCSSSFSSSAWSSSAFLAMSCLHESQSWDLSQPQRLRSLVTTSLHLRCWPPAVHLPCSWAHTAVSSAHAHPSCVPGVPRKQSLFLISSLIPFAAWPTCRLLCSSSPLAKIRQEWSWETSSQSSAFSSAVVLCVLHIQSPTKVQGQWQCWTDGSYVGTTRPYSVSWKPWMPC